MSDFRFRRLERRRTGGTRDQMEIAYPVPSSPSGKFYQFSPNPEATPRLFLIGDAPAQREIADEHRSLIRRDPGPGQTVCPYSGFIGDDGDFVHFADIEAINKQVEWEAAADVEDHLADMARQFNRRQPKGGFLSISMDFKPSHRPKPIAFREDLLRSITCGVCARDYAVYAIALFCPDCGAPNFAQHFQREAALIHEQSALAETQDREGKPEIAYRLMGNAHEDVLTAFETALKTIYRHLIRSQLPERQAALTTKKAIGNAFQNMGRARERFSVLGIDPFTVLSAEEQEVLRLNIEKRHVIGHNLGIADEHYAELTQADQPGETVKLLGGEIDRFALLCLRVVATLEVSLAPEAPVPDGAPASSS